MPPCDLGSGWWAELQDEKRVEALPTSGGPTKASEELGSGALVWTRRRERRCGRTTCSCTAW